MYGMLKAKKKQKQKRREMDPGTIVASSVSYLLLNALKHSLPYASDLVLLYR